MAIPVATLVAFAAAVLLLNEVQNALGESWIGEASPASLARATVVARSNPLGWYRLGLLQSRNGDSEAVSALRRAAELASSESGPRIALGLELEREGRLDEAEQALLSAAETDAGFRPRWNLANYYLRRNDWERFWPWIRESIEADPRQLDVAASLCWRAQANPVEILEKAIPDQPETNRAYFSYLSGLGDLDALSQAWPRFSRALDQTDALAALDYIDQLILAERIDQAVESWNLLCDKSLTPYSPVGAERQRFLTNPYFEADPSGAGFDWRMEPHRGVTWSRVSELRGRHALDLRFSGAQDSDITLMAQLVPVAAGAYAFSFEFATQGMPSHTGVGWTVSDAYSGETLRPFEGLNNAEGFWDVGEFAYTVPEKTRAAIVELRYRSADDGPPRRGALLLRNLRLEQNGSSQRSAP